jgi:hypothetical protein
VFALDQRSLPPAPKYQIDSTIATIGASMLDRIFLAAIRLGDQLLESLPRQFANRLQPTLSVEELTIGKLLDFSHAPAEEDKRGGPWCEHDGEFTEYLTRHCEWIVSISCADAEDQWHSQPTEKVGHRC